MSQPSQTQKSQKTKLVFVLIFVVLVIAVRFRAEAQFQQFNSGSTGADGALNIITPGVTYFDPQSLMIDPEGDNIFNFTTITIKNGSILKISELKVHGPVYFLAQGDVTINGVIDVSGENSHGPTLTAAEQIPAFAGSGGYSGGLGGIKGDPSHPALQGNGPGGGVAGDVSSTATNATGGAFTTNRFLVPLVGGSGGGGTNETNGQYGAQGGAGGGAFLIASSTKIVLDSTTSTAVDGLFNGVIYSTGGNGSSRGCGGAGGAVRLVTNSLVTSSNFYSGIRVHSGTSGSGACKTNPQDGLTRLEYNTGGLNTNGNNISTGPVISSLPFSLNLPTEPPPVIKVSSINGIAVNANPFSFPDATINSTAPVPVVISAKHLPTNATVILYLLSDTSANQSIPVTLVGTEANSSATVPVTFASGGTRGFVKATW